MNQPARSTGLALIKTSVIAMGVLILLGVGVLVYNFIAKSSPARSPSLDAANAAMLRLGLPAETQVKAMTLSDRALAVHLAIPGQGEWIYVVPLAGEGRLLKIAIGAGETK